MLDRRKKIISKNGYGAEVLLGWLETLIVNRKGVKRRGFRPEQFRQLSSHYNLLFSFRTNKDLKKRYIDRINDILTKGAVKQ